jgi:hypothetical protein
MEGFKTREIGEKFHFSFRIILRGVGKGAVAKFLEEEISSFGVAVDILDDHVSTGHKCVFLSESFPSSSAQLLFQ